MPWRKRSSFSGGVFDVPAKEERLAELVPMIEDPTLWNDPQQAQGILREDKMLKDALADFNEIHRLLEDVKVLHEFCQEDESNVDELTQNLAKLEKLVADYELTVLLSDEHDPSNAYLTINAGAGGTESQDWGSMLMRMYTRWAEKRKFKVTIMEYQEGEEAGIKSVTLFIEGLYAYGNLKSETGVHRLVRISPFDSNARRHTSFTSVLSVPRSTTPLKWTSGRATCVSIHTAPVALADSTSIPRIPPCALPIRPLAWSPSVRANARSTRTRNRP